MTRTRPMPADHSLPESRAEATEARQKVVDAVLDIPSRLEKKTLRWFVIFLVMMIFMMGAGALWYFQRQLMALQVENAKLRDQLTNYLVVANTSTIAALDRNTVALNECSRIMVRMESTLDKLSARGGAQ